MQEGADLDFIGVVIGLIGIAIGLVAFTIPFIYSRIQKRSRKKSLQNFWSVVLQDVIIMADRDRGPLRNINESDIIASLQEIITQLEKVEIWVSEVYGEEIFHAYISKLHFIDNGLNNNTKIAVDAPINETIEFLNECLRRH